jgi:hypothetical protein
MAVSCGNNGCSITMKATSRSYKNENQESLIRRGGLCVCASVHHDGLYNVSPRRFAVEVKVKEKKGNSYRRPVESYQRE